MNRPLLGPFAPDHVIAFGREHTITVGQFLRDVAALAARLPNERYVLNDCFDRYHFLVGFAAAMVRGQVSLLPGARVPHVWQQLAEDYPGLYCLSDQGDAPGVMTLLPFPREALGTDGAVPPVPDFPDAQLAAIAFTSGSTGRPKPYQKFWGALAREAGNGGRALRLDVAQPGAIVATAPPQHMYGFITTVLIPLVWGYAVSRERPFYPEDVRLALASCPGPAWLVITPVQLRACVLDKPDFPPVQFILSSAAPLPRAVAEEAEAQFHTRVYEYYGSTETGAIALRRQQESDVWRTFDEVRVRPHPDGYLVEADYFMEPVVLNDTVEILGPSNFRLLGRNTDLVKIGGKRTSLLHLNQQLQELSGVADGAFLLEDSDSGREPRLTAFVVAPGQTRAQILDALRQRVDEVFLPRKLWLVPSLPRNAAGKLPRENMLALLREQLGKERV